MTPKEKVMFRFLLAVLVVGLIAGFVRRTWFSESLVSYEEAEMMASDVASMAQENRARYLQALETGTLRGISATRGDASGAVFTEKINLNTATEAELMSLPGIGPAMAKRILAYRQNYGDFGSVEDLANVKGIGEKTIGKLRDLVTL